MADEPHTRGEREANEPSLAEQAAKALLALGLRNGVRMAVTTEGDELRLRVWGRGANDEHVRLPLP